MLAAAAGLLIIALSKCSASNVSDKFYPYYHLAPPFGWMNDPNGFSVIKDEYHMFYQYNPNSSQEAGIAHWGHAKSSDLFNWVHLPIALYPDQEYDKTGVFSGSAIVHNDTTYLFYTGNVNFPGQNPNKTQREALAYSTDGVNFTKYPGNPIIKGEEYQPDLRDPKVWKYGDTFYMVLGNSFNNSTLGRVLLYTSKDLITWEVASIIGEADTADSDGYMWECPDFFELNEKWVLLYSPQGLTPQGDKYKNLYQTGYIIGNFEYDTNTFTPITDFKEIDFGTDFYATQTILDQQGRRIMVGWCDMWERVYPERDDGWTGLLTIPRVLYLTGDNKIIQKPVEEIANVRGSLLFSGKGSSETNVTITNNAGEIRIVASKYKDFELVLEAANSTVTIKYEFLRGRITLDRGGDDGFRRTKWRPRGKLVLDIYIDRSSVEMFCGEGEVTFSSRIFPLSEISVKLGAGSSAEEMSVYSMKRTVPAP